MGRPSFLSPHSLHQSSRTSWTPYLSPLSPRSPIDDRKEDTEKSEDEVIVSVLEKAFNFLGCIAAAIIYAYLLLYSNHLWTIDTSASILLAEYCGWSNERLRRKAKGDEPPQEEWSTNLSTAEKGGYFLNTKSFSESARQGCIAAVVGYREDPIIFTKALQSYLQADGCRFMVVSIDGNGLEDQEMVDVFQQVFPENSAVLNISIPFVEIALQMDRDKPKWLPDADIISKCIALAKLKLVENNIHLKGPDAITRLCITQPHMHKKGVMFTSFIMCMAISELLGIEFLWTSDSDSIVGKETLTTTIETMAGDPKCAGASTALAIHNRDETLVTKLGNTVYLNELHLSRCFSSAVGANDCQSGPCATFRIDTLRSELLAWYKQRVWGHWMIINEDRHLTTRLLLLGHRIRFISDAITATETPVSLRRWLLQQVRWARSVHIESYAHPSIYLSQPPLFFFAALRRQLISFFILAAALSYFFTGTALFLNFSFRDYAYRALFTLVYLKARNPIRPTWEEWCWSIPSGLFYNVPLPAIQLWSLITMFADGWGTSMRGSKEVEEATRWREFKKKAWEVGFFVVWMGVIGGIGGRWLSLQAQLEGSQRMICMAASVCVSWIGFGWWMVTME
ncbi:glycosyltransferase family 2 protein [Periconia macrospinosa]|uniref:Glycosyltransferase family 2 protein n=1 Tax=Periconia macrospinosa TaxID=97972 RepID=A0A2V1EF20_9PLEO|nr:glycosyltransferase family 2 protein [Periconia macrospinosa]